MLHIPSDTCVSSELVCFLGSDTYVSYQQTKRTTSLSFWCLDWYSTIVSVKGNDQTAQCQRCVSTMSIYSYPIVPWPCHPWYRHMKWMLVSQAALSKPLDNVILASWKSLPCCSSSLSHPLLWSVKDCWSYCHQFVVKDFPQVGVTTHGDCQKLPQQYPVPQCQVSASDPFTWESFLHILKLRHLAFR